MAFTNSPLVNYTRISPNKTTNRNHAIDTITIHCVVGQCSVETLGEIFSKPSKQASSNYGIGYDGRIGMYVEEKDRSWCYSSGFNDNRAITIEVASDTTSPYAVNSKAYASLIKLVTDICKRNGIKELKWKADKSLIGQVDKQNMTVHRWFANKSCPGEYLYSRMGKIAEEVNKNLGVEDSSDETVKPDTGNTTAYTFSAGDLVSIARDAKYYNGSNIPNWVKNKKWYVKEISGDRAVIDKSEDGKNSIESPVNVKYLKLVKTGQQQNSNDSNDGNDSNDSNDSNDTNSTIKTGDLVTITNDAKYYDGKNIPSWVKSKKWYVIEVFGDRAVIDKSEDGENSICSSISTKYLKIVTDKSDLPYLVRVDINNLNIRKGPGTNYSLTGAYTGVGAFTIVEVSNGTGSKTGWGRLKSGAGWICLDFTKRV